MPKTLFRIASHFLTNIEYSHKVSTLELTLESEYEFFLRFETLRFPCMPKLENLFNHKAKIEIA